MPRPFPISLLNRRPLLACLRAAAATWPSVPVRRLEMRKATKNPVFTFDADLLQGAQKTDRKAYLRPRSSNPVGMYWQALSKPHDPGTPDPARAGTSENNGCIHLTHWDMLRLAQRVKIGFMVNFHA